jgi:hypothetical protein
MASFPFAAKIAFEALLRVVGDNWNEEDAVLDLVPDLLIPRVPAAQLALVEKHLDAGRTQRLANPLGRVRILRGVAQEYRVRWLSHRRSPLTDRRRSSHCLRRRQLTPSG